MTNLFWPSSHVSSPISLSLTFKFPCVGRSMSKEAIANLRQWRLMWCGFMTSTPRPSVYVDLGPGPSTPSVLTLVTMGPNFDRKWKIKVSQIPCNTDYTGKMGEKHWERGNLMWSYREAVEAQMIPPKMFNKYDPCSYSEIQFTTTSPQPPHEAYGRRRVVS